MKNALILSVLLLCSPATAQSATEKSEESIDTYSWFTRAHHSLDSDGTEVNFVSLGFRQNKQQWAWGLELENASWRGAGFELSQDRAFLTLNHRQSQYELNSRLSYVDDTLVGSGTLIANRPWRSEWFVERDRLETRTGVSSGLYHSFVGMAQDIPVSKADTLALVAGMQWFTGENRRAHLRANWTHLLSEENGFAAQVQTRWYKDSVPGEFDYFAPGEYSSAVANLLWSRRIGPLRSRLVLGAGQQYIQASGSESVRQFEYLLETARPDVSNWNIQLRIGYTDAAQSGFSGGSNYWYRYGQFRLSKRF